MESSLVVDFHGPIAFRFSKDWAWAYLPKCHLHACNVLTDHDDKSPDRHHTFVFDGPKSGKTQDGGGGEKLILLDWRKDANAKESKDNECYCRFQLRAPDFIYGLRGDYIYMQSKDQRKWDGSYARGLRFYYKASAKPTIKPTIPIVPNSNGSNDLSTLNSECVGQAQDPAIRYRIEIRFHDLNPVRDPDNPHADAEGCSLSMRRLFPPMDEWIVHFGKTISSAGIEEGRYALILGDGRPVDCGAHTLGFNDGGLS